MHGQPIANTQNRQEDTNYKNHPDRTSKSMKNNMTDKQGQRQTGTYRKIQHNETKTKKKRYNHT